MGSILAHWRILFVAVLMLQLAGLTGCASTPAPPQAAVAEPVATASTPARPRPHPGLEVARHMLGAPYRYGGAGPRGFDCSGLVYYSYRRAGLEVPRTASEQYRQSEPVELAELRPGDLIFFRISRNKPSHVGIYAGDDRFIHAPSGGKRVSYASLGDPYWRTRIIGAGRVQ
jgi:cell wall-associated NlpC family hydrolase